MNTLKTQQRNLIRRRQVITKRDQTQVRLTYKRLISFSSNDYLGLSQDASLGKSFAQACDQYGIGGQSSQLLTGFTDEHYALEKELAEFLGMEKAILFSSGYLANLAVITTLANRQTTIFQDRLNHASLLDAGLFSSAKWRRYQHVDTNHLDKLLSKCDDPHKIIITEGVFSMEGDIAPLPQITKLANKHQALLIVDDAHGLGVLGKYGRGVIEHFNLNPNQIDCLIGTFGKAFGCMGAFVAGKADLIKYLIQFARPYIYTTALPACFAAAARQHLKLLHSQNWRREKLNYLINLFNQSFEYDDLYFKKNITPIRPIIIGEVNKTLQVSEILLTKGLLIPAIRPPTVPQHKSRLRISFSALHNETEIKKLAREINSILMRIKS